MSDFKLVYITCSNKEEAKKLTKLSLEKNLVACANILPEIESFYKWQGKIKSDTETILLFKTTNEKLVDLRILIQEAHSYDCPCILAFDIDSVNALYGKFLINSVS